MTTPDELRDIVRYLQGRIELVAGRSIVFDVPSPDEMTAAGLEAGAAHTILSAPWWSELVDDVVETPDFADPHDSDDAILGYAQDVVQEYVWKRFDLGS
ncbi:MAG: hypothetical protein V2I67_01900 [Thermoanaerobaculales bacterium]|nr:hypothetical protein [Thermoanaerobaculales bacterium]